MAKMKTRVLIVGAVSVLVASTGVVGFAFADGGQVPDVAIAPTQGPSGSEVTISWSCPAGDVAEVSDARVVTEPPTTTTSTTGEGGEPADVPLDVVVTPGDLDDGSTAVTVPEFPVGTQLTWTVTCTSPDSSSSPSAEGDDVGATATGESPMFTVTEPAAPAEPDDPSDGPGAVSPAAGSPVVAAGPVGPTAVTGVTVATVTRPASPACTRRWRSTARATP